MKAICAPPLLLGLVASSCASAIRLPSTLSRDVDCVRVAGPERVPTTRCTSGAATERYWLMSAATSWFLPNTGYWSVTATVLAPLV